MTIFQAANLSSSINQLNTSERIIQASNIATALVNVTQQPIYAEDINLAVDIVSTLNEYDHLLYDDMRKYIILQCYRICC